MAGQEASTVKEKLLQAGLELFRKNGYVATTVDQICAQAGVTKGAFFHHFKTKEAIAEACLEQWDSMTAAMEKAAPFQSETDPLRRVLGYMEFFIGLFQDPKLLKSCLAGTIAQETSDTHPALRAGANACLMNVEQRFESMLDAACQSKRLRLDTRSLAALWIATVQGSLILYKASKDESVIPNNLKHVKEYIQTLFAVTNP